MKAAEAALKDEKAQVEAEKQVARDRTAVDQKAAGRLQKERAEIVVEITPAVYQQLHADRKDAARHRCAEAVDGRCRPAIMALRRSSSRI